MQHALTVQGREGILRGAGNNQENLLTLGTHGRTVTMYSDARNMFPSWGIFRTQSSYALRQHCGSGTCHVYTCVCSWASWYTLCWELWNVDGSNWHGQVFNAALFCKVCELVNRLDMIISKGIHGFLGSLTPRLLATTCLILRLTLMVLPGKVFLLTTSSIWMKLVGYYVGNRIEL